MIQQQQHNTRLLAQARALLSSAARVPQHRHPQSLSLALGNGKLAVLYGGVSALSFGLWSAMIRESIYAVGYLSLAPILMSSLQTHYSLFHNHPVQASFTASIVAGLTAATITHPVDTVKTCIQG